MEDEKVKIKIVFLALVMLTNIGSANWAIDHDWKYSELVNFSTEDFLASIKNNVSIAVNNIEIANQTHDYDAIVENATLIEQNDSILFHMEQVLGDFGLTDKARSLWTLRASYLFKENTENIIRDAKMRVEERNKDIEEQEEQKRAMEYENQTKIAKDIEEQEFQKYLMEYENQSKSRPEPVLRNVRDEFGNYTINRKDEVNVRVKKGTDVFHAMALEDLSIEYGTTADSADYTITSSGTKLKGYIDYTMDGFVVIVQPKKKSLTKREFIKILDTFHRD